MYALKLEKEKRTSFAIERHIATQHTAERAYLLFSSTTTTKVYVVEW